MTHRGSARSDCGIEPAEKWIEGLPIGNGRLGAMVYGRIKRERLQLNEHSLWAGRPLDRTNPEAAKRLDEVRDLLFEGEHERAEELADETLVGRPRRWRSYESIGHLRLDFEHGDVEDYHRELDLDSGIARVQHPTGETTVTREAFVSAPEDVLVVRVETDGPSTIDAEVSHGRSTDARTATVEPTGPPGKRG